MSKFPEHESPEGSPPAPLNTEAEDYDPDAPAPTSQEYADKIATWLRILVEPGTVCELRALQHDGKYKNTFAGYYDTDHLEIMAAMAQELSAVKITQGCYFTINPVEPDLLARCANRAPERSPKHTVTDSDITRRSRLFIDLDPVRKNSSGKPLGKGISTTEAEKGHGLERAWAIRERLTGLGWPEPALCDTGNGFALYYGIDLPVMTTATGKYNPASDTLIRSCLQALSARFSDGDVEVDTAVFNPSRIAKIPGTWARKGDSTGDRPHRRSALLSGPDRLSPVPIGLLDALAAEAPAEPARGAVRAAPGGGNGQGRYAAVMERMRGKPGPGKGTFARALAYVMKMAPSRDGQEGHKQLFSVAMTLVDGFGLDRDEAMEIFRQFNERADCDPEDERQLHHKLDGAIALTERQGGPSRDKLSRSPDEDEDEGDEDGEVFTATGSAWRLINYARLTREEKSVSVALSQDTIARSLAHDSGGWPKRVGSKLFVLDNNGLPLYLNSSTQLFAWVDRVGSVDWKKSPTFITQERFYESLRASSESFTQVESLPHWPALPTIYYTHSALPNPTGAHLDGLLGYFHPFSPEDGDLIRALVLTLFWGGHPGSRPAFLIAGPDGDTEGGRGVGKSKLVDVLADELAGGAIDVAQNSDLEAVRTRMLSEEARGLRVARLDNVKTLRLSWADLEGMITSPVISGRELYHGEGRRPNTFTWVITQNGGAMSKDMAQRVVIIKLARPTPNPGWEEEVRAYARVHKWAILADVGELFSQDIAPQRAATRWASWEQGVLARCRSFEACQRLMVERQGLIDDDTSERDLVLEYFRERIRGSGRDPATARVTLHSSQMREWLVAALAKPFTAAAAGRYLSSLSLPELSQYRTNEARLWCWSGVGSDPTHTPQPLPYC